MPAHHDEPSSGTEDVDVLVVGGGLAGLTAACTAAGARPGLRVVVLDGHPLGGRAWCDRRQGYVLNRGPRALYEGGPARRILADLAVDVSSGGRPATGAASGSTRGRLQPLPTGPAPLLRSGMLSPTEKVGFALAARRLGHLDPTDWVGRPLADLVAELRLTGGSAALFHALVRLGTYAHAPEHLDAGAALHQLRLGGAGVRYLDGGWQSVVDSLAATAVGRGVHLRPGTTVLGVRAPAPDAPAGPVLVATDTGPLRAHRVVLAAGGPESAVRLLGARPGWRPLGPAATVACLEVGVRRPPRTRFVLGIDEPTYLSVHAPPASLAPPGHAVVHLLRYHHPDETPEPERDRARLRSAAAAAGIAAGDVEVERFLAHMTVTGALPTSEGGGIPGRPAIESPDHPGVLLAGDWVGPEGLLADAAVSSGARAGRQAALASATMAGT